MILIDKLAYKSKLAKTNALQKAILTAILLLACLIASSNALSICTIVFMLSITLVLGGANAKQYLKFAALPLVFLVIGIIPIIFQTVREGTQVLLSFNLFGINIGVSQSNLVFGINIALKAFAAVSCLYFFILTTPMANVLNLLKKLKCPQILTQLMELIYRFIFVVFEQASKIFAAQSSRLGYIGLKNSIHSAGELASGLFIHSIRRVDNLNQGMESRNFDTDYSFIANKENPSKIVTVLIVGSIIIISFALIIERII